MTTRGGPSFEIPFRGEIVERQELLNGTQTVTFEATSDDGAWTLSGMLSWSRGLIDFAGEGDLTLASGEDEVYATVAAVEAGDAGPAGSWRLSAEYEVDGGTGAHEGAVGCIRAQFDMTENGLRGRMQLNLSKN